MLQRFGLIEDLMLHHLQYLSRLERLLIQLSLMVPADIVVLPE